jgi:acyl carrier protein
MTAAEIQDVVLAALRNANLARKADAQLAIAPDAPIFGPGSPLDSLGLVSLLIDIEEAMQDRGIDITLGDARAMSETRSPFRSVPALVQYIETVLPASGAPAAQVSRGGME